MLVTRLISIFGLANLSNIFTKVDISLPEQTVLWWGGLRGSVSIALALSVPVSLNGRQDIIDTVFGVVLFTLLIQGLTTQWVLKKLNLVGDQPLRQEYSELLARKTAVGRVMDYFKKLDESPSIDSEFYRYEQELVKGELKSIEEKIYKFETEYPQLKSIAMQQLKDKLLDIEADTYAELIRSGQLGKNLSPVMLDILSKSGE